MLRTNTERAVRFLRRRRGWRQVDLGVRAGVSREAVSRLERGQMSGLTLDTIRRVASALDASVYLEMRWRGEQLDRLIDAAHAGLQEQVARKLGTLGWLVRAEVSFNHYGDRGRVDILALHPASAVLLVVEVKSRLGDLQDSLGRLDVKVRMAPMLARQVGWATPVAVVPALVLGEGRTARRVVASHSTLFARYSLRGRAALVWIRRPRVGRDGSAGLLWYEVIRASGDLDRAARIRHVTPSEPFR